MRPYRLLAMLAVIGAAWSAPVVIPAGADPLERATWVTYTNGRFGFKLEYPANLFTPGPAPLNDDGRLWTSKDGKARLLASAGHNSTEETLASYRRFVMEESYKGAVIDYAPVRNTWFVLSGTLGDKTFYERITFACKGRMIYGWAMTYPTAEKALYDRIVEEVHKSYRPGRGEDGDCG